MDELVNTSSLTQEFRLSSLDSGPWKWTIGSSYRHFIYDQNQPVNYYGIAAGPLPEPYESGFDSVSNSWAVFGDANYQVTNRINIGAGLRDYHDNEELTPPTQTGTFHSVDPRFYARYNLTDNVNIYASAAEGFRSGGFNTLNAPSYGPENVWTYELGTKMTLIDNRLSADIDGFYSDYSNYQLNGIVPGTAMNITHNGGDVRIDGIEWDFAWRPTDRWRLGFNGDYLTDFNFTKITLLDTSHIVGDPVDLVPRYTFTVSMERDFILDGKPGYVRVDYNQQGPESIIDRSVGPWYSATSDVIHMLNLHAELNVNEHLRIGAFVQNLLNDRGLVDPYNSNVFSADEVRPRPRTIGLEVGSSF